MLKVIGMAIFYGLIKVGLWLWKKKWWILALEVLWLLGRHHFFNFVIPWIKSLHLTADIATVGIFAGIGGAVIGSFVTGMIMYGMRKEKSTETYERW